MYKIQFIISPDSKFSGKTLEETYNANDIKELAEQSFPLFRQALNIIRGPSGLEAAVYMEPNPSPHLTVMVEEEGECIGCDELLEKFFLKRVRTLMSSRFTLVS